MGFVLGVEWGFWDGQVGFFDTRGLREGLYVSSGMERGEVRGPVGSIEERDSGTRSILVWQEALGILTGFAV